MADGEDDPIMPKRPPIAALRAIEQIRAYRSWEPIEVYSAIREPPSVRVVVTGSESGSVF